MAEGAKQLIGLVNKIVKPTKTIGAITRDLQLFIQQTNAHVPASERVDLTDDLEQIVVWMHGELGDTEVQADPTKALNSVQELVASDLLTKLFNRLTLLPFEARKSFTKIFEYALTQCRDITVPHIDVEGRIPLLRAIVRTYDTDDASVALAADAIFRACIVIDPICETIFNVKPSLVMPFLKYVQNPEFAICSHAFDTLRLLLTHHPDHASNYLRENYDEFFAAFNELLMEDKNYMVNLEAFHLLSTILTSAANHDTMVRYTNNVNNLKLAMIQTRNSWVNVQFAAFNVLKIFVPNPFKSDPVTQVLVLNKRTFLDWLRRYEAPGVTEEAAAEFKLHRQEMIHALEVLPNSLDEWEQQRAAKADATPNA